MAYHGIAVCSLDDGRILRLPPDAWCVPLPPPLRGRALRIEAVERGFEDLACVTYADGEGLAGYVMSEARLDTRGAGEDVVVRGAVAFGRQRWMVVRVGAEPVRLAAGG